MSIPRTHITYTMIGCVSILLWGCILPLIRLAMEEQGMFRAIFGVQIIAAVSGLAVVLYRKALPLTFAPYRTPAFILRLLFFTLHVTCIYLAVGIVPRSTVPAVIFCNYLWPSLVLFYSIPIAGLKIPRPTIFFLGTLVIILALLIEFGWHGFSEMQIGSAWRGIALALVGANAWGLYSAISRRSASYSGGAAVTPLFHLACAVVAVAFLPNLLSSSTEHPPLLAMILSWPIITAGIFNFIAYLCWDIGIRKGSVIALSLLADFIPWLSLSATSFLLGLSISSATKFSAALLVLGALITRIGTIERRKLLP